jgi:hypothetical protein
MQQYSEVSLELLNAWAKDHGYVFTAANNEALCVNALAMEIYLPYSGFVRTIVRAMLESLLLRTMLVIWIL